MMEASSFSALLLAWLWPIPAVGAAIALILLALRMRRSATTVAAFGLTSGVALLIALVQLLFSGRQPSSGAWWPTLLLVLVPTVIAAAIGACVRFTRAK